MVNQMRASVLNQYRKIELMDVAKPDVSGKEILVKVKYASICGSDQHIFLGEFHPRTKLPLIPGHEFAGDIFAVGPEVENAGGKDSVGLAIDYDVIHVLGFAAATGGDDGNLHGIGDGVG